MSLFPFSKPSPGAQIDWTHPLSRGLVGCWLFNEGAGIRANDLSPYGNHGVLTNFEPFSATSGWTGGKFGTALQFDGSNNVINCGDSDSLDCAGKDLTIELWLYPSSTSVSQHLVNKLVLGSGYRFEIRSDNTLRLAITATLSTFVFVSNANALTLNKWQHIVATYDHVTGLARIYVNAVDWGSGIISEKPAISAGTERLGIGARYDGTSPYTGSIDEVRIWNHAQSSQEVQYLYSNPFCMFKARPIGVRQY